MKKIKYLTMSIILFLCFVALMLTIKIAKREKEKAPIKEFAIVTADISHCVSMASKQITNVEIPDLAEYRRTDIPMPVEHQELLYKACKETGCAYITALAVCWVETGMRNISGDNGNSLGYMQIQPKWVKQRMKDLGVTDLLDPYSNFLVGTSLLAEYINEYGTIGGLTKYNSGKAGNSRYAEKVLEYRGCLESEFG